MKMEKLCLRGYFFLGTPDSTFKIFHDNGQLAEEGQYNSIPDSIREFAGSYVKIIDGLPHIKVGTWKTYFDSGKPSSVILYSKEDTVGKLIDYWNSKGEHLIENGNGSLKEYYASGKMKEETTYKNGKMNGPYKSWNANGKLQEE